MKKKTYEVRGMMEWHPVFTVGRTHIRVPFTGGYLSDGAVTPATFETADAVVQTVIEQSKAYKSKRIRLRSVVDIEIASTRSKINSPEKAPEQLKVIECGSWEEAADSLQYTYGVAVECLKDEASCKAEAGKLGFELKFKK